MIDYPRIENAKAEVARLYALQATPHEHNPSFCRICRQRTQAISAAHDSLGGAAYADELLPALLGGQWRMSSTGASRLVVYLTRTLFDHPTVFRRCGSRGPVTWDNGVIIAHPYDGAVDNERDRVDAQAIQLADHGIHVWLHRGLSTYYPDSTYLVVAARGLRDAEQFGFESLNTVIDYRGRYAAMDRLLIEHELLAAFAYAVNTRELGDFPSRWPEGFFTSDVMDWAESDCRIGAMLDVLLPRARYRSSQWRDGLRGGSICWWLNAIVRRGLLGAERHHPHHCGPFFLRQKNDAVDHSRPQPTDLHLG